MTVTLNPPPGKEAAFQAQAQARGLSLALRALHP